MLIASLFLAIAAQQLALSGEQTALVEPSAQGAVEDPATPIKGEPRCPVGFEPPETYPAGPTPNCDRAVWVRPGDYPASAILAGEEGTTAFTLAIDTQGRPTACKINQSSGSQRLDDLTCRLLLQRARFVPAFSEEGKAVAGKWHDAIDWQIPESDHTEPPLQYELVYIIEKNGTISSCDLVGWDSGQVEDAMCATRPGASPILRDFDGNPLRVRLVIKHSIEATAIEDAPAMDSSR